ncbi:MAG: hypothetical protein [Caudoviricetes sp.]|nr:MAG: hypothetical protein [Caudoviricetes sp.]
MNTCNLAKLGTRCGSGTVRKKDCRKNILILCEGEGANFPPIIGRQYFLIQVGEDCSHEVLRVIDRVHDILYFSCLDNKKICVGDRIKYLDVNYTIDDCANVIDNTTCSPCSPCGNNAPKKTPLRNFIERIKRGRE